MGRQETTAWVLLSGGIDSTACVDHYKKIIGIVRGIYIDYGQTAAPRERLAATDVAKHYDIPLSILEWRGGKQKGPGEIVGRNAFLLVAAMVETGDSRGLIATGIHDGTPYFDCSQEFLSTLQKLADG